MSNKDDKKEKIKKPKTIKKTRLKKANNSIKEKKVETKETEIEKKINLDVPTVKEEKVDVQKEEKHENIEKRVDTYKEEKSSELVTNVTFNLLEVIIIILITGVVVSIISGLIVYNNYGKIRNIEKTTTSISQKELNEFVDNYNIILNKYVDDVDSKELLDAAISGMYNYLDDFSTYIDTNTTETLSDELDGEYEGIGIEIGTLSNGQEKITLINRVFKDSPADKAGLKPGDIFSKIDGIDLAEKDSSYIANYIKNGEKSKFEVIVLRDKEEVTVTIERSHVIIDTASSETIDKNTKLLKITSFSNSTRNQIVNELDSYDKNVTNLIVDLRDNTGGLLTAAESISDLFVEKGKNLYQIKDRDGNIATFKAEHDIHRKFNKIVVIINKNSASASEILALALKESSGATIVGTNSYGKGTVQETKKLKSGAMVKFTTSYWLSPNGNSINKVGITPDVVEENPEKQVEVAKKQFKK